jgi:hypothetical protein
MLQLDAADRRHAEQLTARAAESPGLEHDGGGKAPLKIVGGDDAPDDALEERSPPVAGAEEQVHFFIVVLVGFSREECGGPELVANPLGHRALVVIMSVFLQPVGNTSRRQSSSGFSQIAASRASGPMFMSPR